MHYGLLDWSPAELLCYTVEVVATDKNQAILWEELGHPAIRMRLPCERNQSTLWEECGHPSRWTRPSCEKNHVTLCLWEELSEVTLQEEPGHPVRRMWSPKSASAMNEVTLWEERGHPVQWVLFSLLLVESNWTSVKVMISSLFTVSTS